MKCPRCEHENPSNSAFCDECGARLEAGCPACGEPSRPGAKFCRKCGQALSEAAAPPATTKFASPEAYTPKHLADRILTSKAALEGERKQVTVLFADLKGSMELLADRDPEEARKILDPVLELMMDAVHRYEGTVNQVMGDGIMALFGAPLAHEDHAVRACYGALRMQDAIRRYTGEVRRTHGAEVQVRVGLNSGEVVVRSIGSDLRMDYTAVGQTTHLAARMEQLAAPGSIRLTAETLRLAEGYVAVRPLGPVPVRGLLEPVEVYELTGAGSARTRLQVAAARGLTRFVGRDAEMEQLRQAAELARRGRGQVVAVVGEPGVGKSRLYYEFVHSHRTHGWLVLEAGSVSYGKATPFLPLVDLLKAYFRIEARDDVRTIRAKVTGTVLTLDEALRDDVAPVVWLLEALGEDDPFHALDPRGRRQRTLDGVKRLLLRESRVQPVAVVFEDLHWVDAETQAFLDSFVESLPAAAVLLAVNYRPEFRHGWNGKTYYRQLLIDELAPETADALLEGLLGTDASISPLRTLLIARTEGNPLFLEESVRALVETGVLAGAQGAYRLVKPLDAVRVPPSVQAILAARIDRLPADDKRLLQAAAAVGKDVPFALLEAVVGLSADALHEGLARLAGAELLYEARLFPEIEYTFKHALTHEVAYGGVLQERRRALHAAIVDAIERVYANRLAEHVEVLAHHAARSRIPDKAVRYLRQAAERSVARSANREGVAFFETALEILAELPETTETLSDALDIHIGLGPALIMLSGAAVPRVSEVYRRGLDLVERLGDASRRFPVLWGLWFISYTNGRYADALQSGKRLLDDARAGDDSGRLLEAHHAMWPTLLAMGESAAAAPHMERGIALYRREEHASQTFLYAGHDPGACCRYQLAQVRWLLGHPDQALTLIRDAERLAEELQHPQTTTITLWMKAWLEYQRGERQAAAQTARQLRDLAGAHGFVHWLDAAIVLPHVTAKALTAPALAALYRELSQLRTAVWRRVFTLSVFAQLCAEAKQAEEGLLALASVGEGDRQAYLAPEVHRLEGELLLSLPTPPTEDAEHRFQTAVEIARRRSEKSLELRAATSLARLWRDRGKRDDARRLLAEVYAWFTEGFDTADLVAARTLLETLAR